VLRRLRHALLGGVTTVRDMGGDARVLAGLARDALLGDIDAPTIVYSAIFAGPDFFSDPRVVASARGAQPGDVAWARVLQHDTDLVRAVAEAKGAGARAIKLYADVPPELLAPLVAEAHRQGLVVWAHGALFPARPSELVTSGVDVISHAALLAWEPVEDMPNYRARARADYAAVTPAGGPVDDVLRALVKRGTIFEPTLFVYFVNERTATAADWAARVTSRAHELGARIATGTDGLIGAEDEAVPNLHEEMRLLVDRAGLSPLDAITAATSVSAAAVGLDDRGTIAPGRIADIVALTADPAADIANTRAIRWVMKRGRRVGADAATR
jgi:imidazolonepropionase-like amidohydrolase